MLVRLDRDSSGFAGVLGACRLIAPDSECKGTNLSLPGLKTMPIDELWALHGEVAELLKVKIIAEQKELERRLARLGGANSAAEPKIERRPYPEVFPKYRNPEAPTETWSGRGKQPRWITSQLKSGKTL